MGTYGSLREAPRPTSPTSWKHSEPIPFSPGCTFKSCGELLENAQDPLQPSPSEARGNTKPKHGNQQVSQQSHVYAEAHQSCRETLELNIRIGILPLMLIGGLALDKLLNLSELRFQDL